MGFGNNHYASVWSVEPGHTGNITRVRLSTSRKNKQTGEYEQDFSGYCTFIGEANKLAAGLKPKDRIRLLECDVSTKYDKVKKAEYVDYKVFGFEMAGGGKSATSAPMPNVDSGEIEAEDCPF